MDVWKKIRMMVFTALGLITMSSQSADSDAVDVPLYNHRGEIGSTFSFSREKLRKAIADRFNDISKVYGISFQRSTANFSFTSLTSTGFNVRFTVFSSTKGKTYADIQCKAFFTTVPSILHLTNCRNNQVMLGQEHIDIPLSEIRYEH